MRFLLVAVYTAALMATGLPRLSLGSAALELSADSGATADLLLAEVMEQGDDNPVYQALPLHAFTGPKNQIHNVDPAAPRQDTRQTNRHQHRDDLYRLKLAFLI